MTSLIPNFITNAGAKAAGALRLSSYAQAAAGAAPAPAPTANADLRLLKSPDSLSLSASALAASTVSVNAVAPSPAPAPAAPAPSSARVGVLGARALKANASLGQAAPPAPTPAPAPVVATPAPAPAPVAAPMPAPAPAYSPESADAKVSSAIAQAADTDAAFKAAEELLIKELEKRHSQPVDKDEKPADKPADKPEEKPADKPADADASKLKELKPEELARLGREDKKGFFDALRPAAEEAEKKYGVPAAITLAQAALETGWAQHIIPGYNIFGIKGTGPAGTTAQGTWEVYSGKKVTITANFAKYHDFYEAVTLHGKLFHNGYYDKAIDQFAKDHDVFNFAKNITGVYATDPSYDDKLSSIIRQYHLV